MMDLLIFIYLTLSFVALSLGFLQQNLDMIRTAYPINSSHGRKTLSYLMKIPAAWVFPTFLLGWCVSWILFAGWRQNKNS